MFSGIFTHTFTQNPDSSLLIEKLNKVGFCKEVNGNVELTPFERNFSFESKAVVSVVNYKDEHTLQIQYHFTPTIVAWLLGICFFPIGFVIFYLPYKAKEDFGDQLFVLKWED